MKTRRMPARFHFRPGYCETRLELSRVAIQGVPQSLPETLQTLEMMDPRGFGRSGKMKSHRSNSKI
jgi:hypothetical protein